jgi:hypothetical protein
MFYCEPCRKARAWPQSFSGSYGKCEICGRRAVCHDTPSSALGSTWNHNRMCDGDGMGPSGATDPS